MVCLFAQGSKSKCVNDFRTTLVYASQYSIYTCMGIYIHVVFFTGLVPLNIKTHLSINTKNSIKTRLEENNINSVFTKSS